MIINFTGKPEVKSKALEELCEKKLNKVAGKITSDNVTSDVNFYMEGKNYVISMVLNVNGEKFIAKSAGDDMYKNIDDCVTKLSSQLRKTKTSKKGSKKPTPDND